MPVKYVDNLKHPGARIPAQEYQKMLDIGPITTREWELCGEIGNTMTIEQVKAKILADREKIGKNKKHSKTVAP